MFTVKIIEYRKYSIIYIKEINNYIITHTNVNSNVGKITREELLEIALKESENEYNRIKNILKSYDNVKSVSASKPSLYTICFHPVRKCNYKCKYCYAGKADYLQDKEISIDTAKQAIDFMLNDWGKDGKRYVVDLSGSGEPLLKLEFIKKIDEYCECKRKEKSKDIKIMFPSNATLVSKENVNYLENNHNILMGVSIDGNMQQNGNRINRSEQSAFTCTTRGIDFLKNRTVGLAATITHLNENVDELYDYIYNRFENADAISMNVVRDYDVNSETSFYDIDIDNLLLHYDRLLDKIYENILEDNYKYIEKLLIGTDTLGIYLCRVFSKGTLNKRRCGIGKCILSVDAKGNLYACNVANGNDDFKVGNIYTGIDEGRQLFFSKINNESNSLCKECWAANICGGECSIISYLVAGNLNSVNKELCTFRKGLILLALKFEHKLKLRNLKEYNKVLKIVLRRSYFEKVIDSGIWVLQEYIKMKKLDVGYTELVDKVNSTDFGIQPDEMLRVLNIYNKNINIYEINDNMSIDNIKLPIISYVNKLGHKYYEYVIICGIDEKNIQVRKPFELELTTISREMYIDKISNIMFIE